LILGLISSNYSFYIGGATYGNGLYAFLDDQSILTTSDIESTHWITTQLSNSDDALIGLTYDKTHGFVATSSDNTYTSKDGINWNSSPLTNCDGDLAYGGPLISFEGTLIITYGYGTGSLYTDYCYSNDAVNWHYVSYTEEYLDITATEFGFVKWGVGTYVNISTDGINWKSSNPFGSNYNYILMITPTSTQSSTLACVDNALFTYDSTSNSWNFENGVGEGDLITLAAVNDDFFLSMITVDDDDEIIESSDRGTSWQEISFGLFDSVYVPYAVNGYALQFSGNSVNYSTDGITWKYHDFSTVPVSSAITKL